MRWLCNASLSGDEETALKNLWKSLTTERQEYIDGLQRDQQGLTDYKMQELLYQEHLFVVQTLVDAALEQTSSRSPDFMSELRSIQVSSERDLLITQVGLLTNAENRAYKPRFRQIEGKFRTKEAQEVVAGHHKRLAEIYQGAQFRIAEYAAKMGESPEQVAAQLYMVRKGAGRPLALGNVRQDMSYTKLKNSLEKEKGDRVAQLDAIGAHFDTIFGSIGRPSAGKGTAVMKAIKLFDEVRRKSPL